MKEEKTMVIGEASNFDCNNYWNNLRQNPDISIQPIDENNAKYVLKADPWYDYIFGILRIEPEISGNIRLDILEDEVILAFTFRPIFRYRKKAILSVLLWFTILLPFCLIWMPSIWIIIPFALGIIWATFKFSLMENEGIKYQAEEIVDILSGL